MADLTPTITEIISDIIALLTHIGDLGRAIVEFAGLPSKITLYNYSLNLGTILYGVIIVVFVLVFIKSLPELITTNIKWIIIASALFVLAILFISISPAQTLPQSDLCSGDGTRTCDNNVVMICQNGHYVRDLSMNCTIRTGIAVYSDNVPGV